jgi:DNA-binding NarL/FixJ family response regulator
MRILVVDDDPHCRSAVRLILADEPGLEVVGECASAADLLAALGRTCPDVALVDWDLPGLPHGEGLTAHVRMTAPNCRIVAMSGRPEQRQYALRHGAVAFVCKGDAPEALLTLLRELVGVMVK